MWKGFHHVDEVESRLIKNMVEEGIPWNTIVKAQVTKCVGDMARRCDQLFKRKGQLFRE